MKYTVYSRRSSATQQRYSQLTCSLGHEFRAYWVVNLSIGCLGNHFNYRYFQAVVGFGCRNRSHTLQYMLVRDQNNQDTKQVFPYNPATSSEVCLPVW